MDFSGVNYLAIGVAVIASMIIGALWYGRLFAKPWLAATGIDPEKIEPSPTPYIVAIISQAVMATILAGIMGHLDVVTFNGGLITAGFCWFGFVATTISVNHRFQGSNWALTIIDSGHWLAVLLTQGAIIGYFGV